MGVKALQQTLRRGRAAGAAAAKDLLAHCFGVYHLHRHAAAAGDGAVLLWAWRAATAVSPATALFSGVERRALLTAFICISFAARCGAPFSIYLYFCAALLLAGKTLYPPAVAARRRRPV